MGVSGSGKTTVGRRLALDLGWEFVDADDRHSAANVAKMRSGVALNDADRAPWLRDLSGLVAEHVRGGKELVLACSALRRAYRAILVEGAAASGAKDRVRFAYLRVDPSVLAARLAARHGHFMPAALLTSQLATLEEPDASEALIVEEKKASDTPAELSREIREAFRLDPA